MGSLGIAPEVPEDAITSPEYQVWRLKESDTAMVPGYVATLITTPFFIELVKIHRVGAVKQRLYTENLLSIAVPMIELQDQQEIADHRIAALGKIAAAELTRDQAKREVEALIKGDKSPDTALAEFSGTAVAAT